MNDPKYNLPDGQFSLSKQLKARKTQQILRTIESNQTRRAQPGGPEQVTSKVISPDFSRPRPAEKSVPVPGNNAAAQRSNKLRLIAIASIVGVIAIMAVAALLILNAPKPAAPAPKPLPLALAHETLDKLKAAGLPVVSAGPITDKSVAWQAGEDFQVKVQRGNDKGLFLLLSYESADSAGHQAFRASLDNKYKDWFRLQAANLLVLISPSTAPVLHTEIETQIMNQLVVPYRESELSATPDAP